MTTKKQFSSFEELVAHSSQPLLVSFYATWCGYCQQFAPILNHVKDQLGNQITVVKIDAEKYAKLAAQYEVQSLPTTLLFVEGELASRIKGVMEAPKLIDYLNKFL
jgi:protein disulfide-isomerase